MIARRTILQVSKPLSALPDSELTATARVFGGSDSDLP